MLCKEIAKNGVMTWCSSPAHPDGLAVASFGMDENFSTGGSLEIFKNDTLPSLTMPVIGSCSLDDDRFNKIAWSFPFADHSHGLIAGGRPDGSIHFF